MGNRQIIAGVIARFTVAQIANLLFRRLPACTLGLGFRSPTPPLPAFALLLHPGYKFVTFRPSIFWRHTTEQLNLD